jgi:hypothetical protein
MAKKYTTISRVRVPEWANAARPLKAGRVYDVTAIFDDTFVQLSYNGDPVRRRDGDIACVRLDGDILTGFEALEVVVGVERTAEPPQQYQAPQQYQTPQRRKSWTAYVPGLLAAVVIIGLPIVLSAYWLYFISWIPGLAVSILLDEWVEDAAPVRTNYRDNKHRSL